MYEHLREHIEQLCAQHGASFSFQHSHKFGGVGNHRVKTVEVYAPVWNEQAYLIALHELGHVVYTRYDMGVLHGEATAWQFVFENRQYVSDDTLRWGALDSWRHYTRHPHCLREDSTPLIEEIERRFQELESAAYAA